MKGRRRQRGKRWNATVIWGLTGRRHVTRGHVYERSAERAIAAIRGAHPGAVSINVRRAVPWER